MHLPGPVVPSQRYSPVQEYGYENRHEGVRMTRQPLSESTGNIQPHSLVGSAGLCYSQLSLSPPIRCIPTPPILPTQALTSTYGTSLRGERSLHRNVSLQALSMGNPRGRKNPIYHHKNFADYRNKVMQKELDKEQPVWPDWLEDAFLDALLLIPQLGRKKFSSKAILYGRNMLITEYLWIYHWTLHPPKKGERIPTGKQREKTKQNPGHPMFRSRKQVSSHIQVLKGFFPTLSTFHFIFPRQKDGADDDRKLGKEEEDGESFKNNRVLISIANGRLPDERPNYEYFSRLLNAENDVFIRPKQCWIFVSSSKIALKEKHATSEDGTTKKQITGSSQDGLCLTEADYPHLKLNESKDYKDLPRQGNQPTVLLHEYTKTLAQKESSSVKEISSRWDIRFPELREKLTAALDDTQPSDEHTSRCVVGPCDTFHFETVLDLHSTSKFPSGSDLNGLVEFTISRPDLHNHSWRSRTCVVKPDELYMSDVENEYWEENSNIDVIPSHRVGCAGVGRCDCTARGSRDTISIPFPATSWANTFIKLAPYVTAEREKKDRERAARPASSLSGRAEREAARMKKENEETSPHLKSKGPSPKDLLSQVAMYQEVWSAPHGETASRNGEADSPTKRGRGKWTRRAVILWTFVPVHDSTDEKGKTTAVPAGTNWRFLTKIDPTSSYHQQQAYVSGSPTVVSRDDVMSPHPGYAQHLNATMQENFGGAFHDASSSATAFTLPSHGHGQQALQHLHQPSHLTGLDDVLDGFSNGLTTPPPSATFAGSYPHNFGADGGSTTNMDTGHTLHHQLSFMSDGTSTTDHSSQASLAGHDLRGSTESFLSGLEVPEYIPDFSTTTMAAAAAAATTTTASSLHNTVGDLTGRFMGGSDVSWADTHTLPAVVGGGTAMEPHWATMTDGTTTGTVGHELQDAWAAWEGDAGLTDMASDYSSRRTSANSLFDEGSDAAASFTLEETTVSLTAMAQHQHHQHHTLPTTTTTALGHPMHMPVLPSHHAAIAQQQQQRKCSPMLAGRKRSRTESIGLDDHDDYDRDQHRDGGDADDGENGGGRERYPAHSIRKLAHHPAAASVVAAFALPGGGAAAAPTAVMDEAGTGGCFFS